MKNLAKAHLIQHGQTVDDWEGVCGELANAVIGPDDDIIHVKFLDPDWWDWHMVPLIGGLVHDAWCPSDEPLPVKDWLHLMFPGQAVEVSLNGDTVYTGDASEFDLDVFIPSRFLDFRRAADVARLS